MKTEMKPTMKPTAVQQIYIGSSRIGESGCLGRIYRMVWLERLGRHEG